MTTPADTAPSPRTDPARRVLIVEDHPELAFIMVSLLEGLRFEIEAVHSGEMAYPTARAFRPHVILLDLGLPVVNGFEIAELIRDDATLTGTILIAVSGFGPEVFPELTRRAGFDHYFTKPADLDQLMGIIAQGVA